MDTWLNRLGQLAMVAIAVAALIAVFRPVSVQPQPGVTGYEPGDVLDLGKIHETGPALLIASRSTCGFCTESIPFWQTITGIPIVWLAVGEDVSTNRKYLTGHGLNADNVVTADDAGVTKISATPTLILVDKEGIVVKVWLGLLGTSRQDDVRSALAGFAAS